MGKLIYLASYPKSGNTWFRAFLTALLFPEHDLNINRLVGQSLSNSHFFEECTGLNASELTSHEIEKFYSLAFHHFTAQDTGNLFVKTHAAKPPVLHDSIGDAVKALYFIRNPLDVAVSFANHENMDFDKIIDKMNHGSWINHTRNKSQYSIPENLATWSEHVNHWADLPFVKAIRYEDMLQNPLESFASALDHIGIYKSGNEIKEAIEKSSFRNLQQLERDSGFKEKNPNASSFFKYGNCSTGLTHLKKHEIERIVLAHRTTFDRFYSNFH